ncbi:hypothetical protein [Methylacidiphilum kamchatkense]|uniref:hypothetical protein n=1 Tax=Methylacidiphilum kamchatkense TaxID=431057 RepID=UPI000A684C99|nr:hypothetical protein [Methylacidiphilum kamchatkense]
MQNKLKVLLINSLLKGGGTDNQCLLLAKGLKELEIPVLVACPQNAELSSLLEDYGIETVRWEKIFLGFSS